MLALVAAACSRGGDGGDGDDGTSPPPRPPVDVTAPAAALVVTAADTVSRQAPLRPLDPAIQGRVHEAVRRVFTATVAMPLLTGEPGELATLFTPGAILAAVGPDRGVVFDEPVGDEPADALRVDRGEIRFRALDAESGQPAVVVGVIDWDVTTGDGTLRVQRTGDLTLVPAGGGWLVDGYAITVTRTPTGGPATTTTAVSSTAVPR